MADLGNPKNTIEVLKKYQFNFAKKFGQNFLIDTHVLEKIIRAAEITKEDYVLEIGPGIGTMTQYLCEAAGEVIAVEIDSNLIPILQDTLSAYDNVTVLHQDILKVDINRLVEEKCGGKPVSYTHLDVYKRQHPGRERPPWDVRSVWYVYWSEKDFQTLQKPE